MASGEKVAPDEALAIYKNVRKQEAASYEADI